MSRSEIRRRSETGRGRAWAASFVIVVLLAGCRQIMDDQPRAEPLEGSDFFADGMSARPLVPGTVARGRLRTDSALYTGMVEGKPVTALPAALLQKQSLHALLTRGQERFNIYCSVCHDRVGNGRGMVVRRGFSAPPSYHIERLRNAPLGHFFDVATNGFGRMPSYADQVSPQDRWAIAAYIRALQVSQYADVSHLGPDDRSKLRKIAE